MGILLFNNCMTVAVCQSEFFSGAVTGYEIFAETSGSMPDEGEDELPCVDHVPLNEGAVGEISC